MKNIFDRDRMKMPKDAGWLIPGLEIKRWFALIFLGSLLIIVGLMILSNLRPVYLMMEFIRKIAMNFSTDLLAVIIIGLGAFCFFKGWQKTNLSILDLHNGKEGETILEALYRRRKLNKGPKIVAIGGGTGLSMLLKGIKKITNNITAVVTVGDDGGSSGRLREEMGVLPPGDIRNCIAALADDEDLVTKLFQYRFKTGEGLEGHSFGNLFLTALCAITGDMVRAVKESSNVLSIRGRVLPSTLDDMKLVAEMEDGRIIHGESNIPEAGGKIKRLFTDPEKCRALEDVILAIRNADLIILGPGSLYTSVIPNLLIEDISKEVIKSSAKKIYVCNIMTQPGETDNYSVSEHLNAIRKHAKSNDIVDAVLVNDTLPKNLADIYEQAAQYPVNIDFENLKDVKVVTKKLIQENKEGLVRHSSNRVARAIYYWFRKEQKLQNQPIFTVGLLVDFLVCEVVNEHLVQNGHKINLEQKREEIKRDFCLQMSKGLKFNTKLTEDGMLLILQEVKNIDLVLDRITDIIKSLKKKQRSLDLNFYMTINILSNEIGNNLDLVQINKFENEINTIICLPEFKSGYNDLKVRKYEIKENEFSNNYVDVAN